MDREQLLQQLHQFPDSWVKTSDVATLLGVTAKQVSQLKTRNAERFQANEHHTAPEPGKPMEWSIAGILVLGDIAGTDAAIATLDALQCTALTSHEESHHSPSHHSERQHHQVDDTHPQSILVNEDTPLQLEGAFDDVPSHAEDAYVARIVAQLAGQTQRSYASHLVNRIEQGVLAEASTLRETPDQVAPVLGELLALHFGLSPEIAKKVVGLT